MACNCGRPKVGRWEFIKRLGTVLRGLDYQGACVLINNMGLVMHLAPCRAAVIGGAEKFRECWNLARAKA